MTRNQGRYFQKHFQAGEVRLFDPVMATGGAFGVGVLEMDSEAEARKFGESDPSVKAGLNKRFTLRGCPPHAPSNLEARRRQCDCKSLAWLHETRTRRRL